MIRRLLQLIQVIRKHCKSWDFLIITLALAFNLSALFFHTLAWILIVTGNTLLIILIGRFSFRINQAISKINQMNLVFEESTLKTRKQLKQIRDRSKQVSKLSRRSLRTSQRLKARDELEIENIRKEIQSYSNELHAYSNELNGFDTELTKKLRDFETSLVEAIENSTLAIQNSRLVNSNADLAIKEVKSCLRILRCVDARYSFYLSTHPFFKDLNSSFEKDTYANHCLELDKVHNLLDPYIRLGRLDSELVTSIQASPEIVVIHQMGKVGSASIYYSLLNTDGLPPVLHTHVLNKGLFYRSLYRKHLLIEVSKSSSLARRHFTSLLLIQELESKFKEKQWKIVTLTREPISRNISAFFENSNLDLLFPSFLENGSFSEEQLDNAIHLFKNKFDHTLPLRWFDENIYEVFGIDLLSKVFDLSKGYETYQEENIAILVVRLENLNDCHRKAFKEFLGVENFQLKKTNQALDKKYYEIYKAFRERITFSDRYIREMYDSRYTRHFYSEEEIGSFSDRWKI